jgi:prepilin-type processing-associated H-X9-DG protein
MTYAACTSRSYHPGGVNVLLMDGSARFVKSSISMQTWRALGTRAGGEVISADAY